MKKGNKKEKIKIIIIIIGILLIVGGVTLLLFLPKEERKQEEEEELKEVVEESLEKILMEYGQILESTILETLNQSGTLLTYSEARNLSTINSNVSVSCDVTTVYENGKLYLEGCEVNGKKISATYGTKQEDDPVKQDVITVYESANYYTLERPKENINKYHTYKVSTGVSYRSPTIYKDSVIYRNDDTNKNEMRNIKTGEKVLANIPYTSIQLVMVINPSYKNYFDDDVVSLEVNGKWGFYQFSDGKELVPPIYTDVGSKYLEFIYTNTLNVSDYIIVRNESEVGVINYKTNSVVIPLQQKGLHQDDFYFWNEDVIFDYYGASYLTGKYDKICSVYKNYILVRQQGNLKLLKIDGEELYNFGNVTIPEEFSHSYSYHGQVAFQFDNNDGGGKCTEVIYNLEKKTGEIKQEQCGAIAKPILYLYPKKKTKVEVTFSHPEYLETTYPKFDGKWEVTAKKDGSLYDKDGKYYYALYWDEKKVHTTNFEKGFYVEKDNAISFLEEKLEKIGLNGKEKNEFIMYWLPILERNKKSLVYFELTEERESHNKIEISPKPDSLLRLVIHIKKVDKKTKIKEQKLESFKREGFTAVEWGGTTY